MTILNSWHGSCKDTVALAPMVGVSDILRRQQLLSQLDVANQNGKEKIMDPVTISGTTVILIGVCLVLILGCVIYIAVKARGSRDTG